MAQYIYQNNQNIIVNIMLIHTGLQAMSHETIFLATCNAMALHCKLQGRLPRVTPHVFNQSRHEKLRCKLQRKQKQLLLFAMLRDKLQHVTPPLQLVSQFFEKEPITIRHNQNAADIFKYRAGVKYNLIAGRKTSCVLLILQVAIARQIASCEMAFTNAFPSNH